MPRLLQALPTLALLLPVGLDAQAPLQPAPLVEQVEWQREIGRAPEPARYDTVTGGEAVLTMGGATLALGAVTLVSMAMLMVDFQGTGPNSSSARLSTVIFTLGGAFVTPAGAHLANRRRGHYSTGVLATMGALAATVGAGLVIGSLMDEPSAVLLIAVPVSMIGAATVAEIATTR